MKGKLSTKTIIIAIITIVLLAVAATGTVLFLKDSGEAAAAEEQNVLPVAGNDNEAGDSTEQSVENEGTNPETSTELEQTENESGEVTATTPSQTTGILTEEPEATTVEQERVVSEETTLGWNNLLVLAEEADYAGIEINYNNLKYTVEYYFDGEIDEELTEVVDKNQKGKVIDTYTDKNKVGYKLDEVKNFPLTISENQTKNIIEVHYIKDESQTQATNYTVKHVVAGEEKDTKTYEGTAWINEVNPTIEIEEGSLAKNTYVGYKFDSIDTEAKEGDKVASGTVITLTYVKDESQTQATNYTVKHVVAGEEKDTKTYNSAAWINEENPTIEIEEGSLAKNTYVGYKFDSIDTEAKEGDKVASGTVITLTYVKDESQTKPTNYTVKHIVAGEEKDTKTYNSAAWINEENPTIEIEEGSLAKNTYVGYKFDSIDTEAKEGDKVASGTVVTLTYVRDDSQTKPTNYTVKHIVAGEEKDTKTYNSVAWINEENPTIEIEEGSLAKNTYVGYKFDSIDTEAKEGDKVASGTVITLIYVKDESQVNKLTYTVKHITVNGKTETEVATNTYEENVYVLDEQKITIKENTVEALETDDTRIIGYMLDESKLPTEKTGDKVANETVITFYYEIIKYPFTVKYYYNNVEDRSAIVEGSAPQGTIITIADKPKDGFEKYAEPTDTEIKASQTENVFKVYYGKPEVEIEKSAPTQVNYGENIHYTITVTNSGFLGTTVTVTDTLEGTSYKDGTSTEPVSVNGNILTWEIQIPAATANGNAVKTIEFDAIVPTQTLLGTTFENTVTSKTKENEESSSDEISTKIKEFDVIYDEYKEGKTGEDLNIIFIIDNSSSMNETIAGQSYANNSSSVVAPPDRTKTRIESAKSAIQSFITSQSNNTMTVIKYNDSSTSNATVVKLIGEGYEATKKESNYGKAYYEVKIGDNIVKLERGYFSTDYEGELNNKNYILGTDGKCYEYIEEKVLQGTQVVGTTITGKTGVTTNSGLSTAVSNMTIGDLRSSFGTYVGPAFDKAKDYLDSTKTNVVIVLSDGAFDGNNYDDKAISLINSGADYIYSVAFGADANIAKLGAVTNIYKKDENGNNTAEKKVFTASDSATLLAQFKAIEEEASGTVQNLLTTNGTVTFAPASNTIQVKENCPITAYITGTTTKVFESTDVTELKNKYGIEIGEDGKTLTWNANTFIANNPDKIQTIIDGNSKITIKYYIPNSN